MPTPDWSRFGRSTAVPILLLVGLLVILGLGGLGYIAYTVFTMK